MSVQLSPTLSPETQAMLYCLQQAVANALECKRRLGQYAIFGREMRLSLLARMHLCN